MIVLRVPSSAVRFARRAALLCSLLVSWGVAFPLFWDGALAIREASVTHTETYAPDLSGRYKLTAYCRCKKCCGKWAKYGLTKTGTRPGPFTIAVDPSVIPLGSVVHIKGMGEFIAEDTGSAIKGRRIDVFHEKHSDAVAFGVQKAEVVIVDLPEEANAWMVSAAIRQQQH